MFYNKKKLKILESELSCYKSDYNHLREFITTLFNKNQEQQQKIDKAIDIVNKRLNEVEKEDLQWVEMNVEEYNKEYKILLEILGGGENGM